VKLLTEGVEEDVQSWDKVLMRGKSSEEYDLSKFETRSEGLELLLHRFDRDLTWSVSFHDPV
jgi:hypothetical protein